MSSTQTVGSDTQVAGFGYALGAYVLWGFFPVYWKFLQGIDPVEILAHRIVWSLLFVGGLIAISNRGKRTPVSMPNRRVLGTFLAAAILLSFNWFLYIWAVNSNHVVETALGYFINPLVNVVLGAAFLGERPRPVQWAAIGLAAAGVLYLTVTYGQPPWISLALAASFGVYGLLRKRAPLGALHGLFLETALMFLPAFAFLAFVEVDHGGAFGHRSISSDGLLAFSGVATALPLLFFAGAVRRLPLTVVGLVQYLAPTIQFLLGVFLYREPFSETKLVGFALIWSGLALFASDALRRRAKARRIAADQA